MALSSHKHALEMNCGPVCTFAVLRVGGCVSARQPCARICALRYPLIDCDCYPSPRPLQPALFESSWEEKDFSLVASRRHARWLISTVARHTKPS